MSRPMFVLALALLAAGYHRAAAPQVVPAEKVIVSVDDEDIEVGLQVEAGTLHELE